MNADDLIAEVTERTGLPEILIRTALDQASAVVIEALERGDAVSLGDLGQLGCRWHGPTVGRSRESGRRVRVDGRWVVVYRASPALRDRITARTEQFWQDPEHQDAWRLADTLIDDIVLYTPEQSPEGLTPSLPDDQVHAACQQAFGGVWSKACQVYTGKVSERVRTARDYLALSARLRWSPEAESEAAREAP